MRIKAIGFDIDGTLYPHYRMFLYSLPSFLAHPLFVMHFSRVRSEMRKYMAGGDFKAAQARLLAEKLRIDPSETAELIEQYLYKAWERPFRLVRPYPHVSETLAAFKNAGLRLGALSDFPVGNKLSVLGVETYFDVILSSEDTGYLKPHKEPFLRLSRELSVEPEEMLYVGNSYTKDIEGARACGMLTAYICRRGSKRDATIKFSQYRELEDAVLRLVGVYSGEEGQNHCRK